MTRAQTNTDKAWFKERMRDAGYTARTMAPLLDMHFTVFSRMLSGQRHVRLAELRKIAELLGESEREVLRHLDMSAITPRPEGAGGKVAKSKHRDAAASGGSGAKYVVPSRTVDPIFGCMAGTLTLLPDVDYTAPADPDWGKVYDG